jgi:hypothetical protein
MSYAVALSRALSLGRPDRVAAIAVLHFGSRCLAFECARKKVGWALASELASCGLFAEPLITGRRRDSMAAATESISNTDGPGAAPWL